ncbi:hypothetical protein [Salinibacter grassmerensis]
MVFPQPFQHLKGTIQIKAIRDQRVGHDHFQHLKGTIQIALPPR